VTDAADRIEALNAKIEDYAKANKIPYVDYYKAMVTGPERSLNPEYSKDGVHPTLEGYLVMEALIKPVIEKVR
jgi:lysophospholipase L1-like esterase